MLFVCGALAVIVNYVDDQWCIHKNVTNHGTKMMLLAKVDDWRGGASSDLTIG